MPHDTAGYSAGCRALPAHAALLVVLSALLLPVNLKAQTGIAIWRSGNSTIPMQSLWDGSSFGSPNGTVDCGAFRILAGAEAPMRDEKILIGVDENKNISVFTWNGSTWASPAFNPVATISESFWWGCDVAYERLSGDALVVWNNGTTGTEGLSYATGTSFTLSPAGTINTPVAGEPKHMHLAASPLSDEMVLVVSNENSQDYALVWDGSAWGNSVLLSPSGASNDRTDISVAYEQQSGRAMVVYNKSGSIVQYRIWNGSGWEAERHVNAPSGITGYSRWTVLASDPEGNRIVLGVLTDNNEVWLNIWRGEAWETSQLATNAAVDKVFPNVAVAFEGLSGEAIAVHGELNSVMMRTWTDVAGWSEGTTAVDIGEKPNSMFLDARPYSDEIMLSVQDEREDLSFVLWNGDTWGDRDELETNTDETRNQPFVFLWDMQPPANRPPVLIVPSEQTVEEGQSLSFDISASDPDHTTPSLFAEDMPDNASFTDNGNGTGTFAFNPAFDQAGTYEVRFIAGDGSLADTATVHITVTPDPPRRIAVFPDSAVVSADSCLQYTAKGYDGGNNEISPGTIAWGLTAPLGSIDGSGLFDAVTVGQGRVTAVSSFGPVDTSAFLEVIPGEPVAIDVTPDAIAVYEGSSTQFHAYEYDSHSNLVSDVTAIAVWSTTDPSGSVIAGLYTAGNELSPPDHSVKASVGVLSDSSAVTVMTSGAIAYLQIELLDGAPLGDTILTTDDDNLKFYCRGYDSGHNLLGDVSVFWTLIGADMIGTVVPGPDTRTALTLSRVGTGRIACSYSEDMADTSGVITCEPGSPCLMVISPDTATVSADSTLQFSYSLYDADGNATEQYPSVTWSVLGGIGTISGSGLFNAMAADTGYIVCSGGVLADTTDRIIVKAGLLSRLVIMPDSILIPAGLTALFSAEGYDSDGNLTGVGSLAWEVAGDIGEIDPQGLFTALNPGVGRIAVTSSIKGITDTNRAVVVVPPTLSRIVVSPDTSSVKVNGTITFVAYGYDSQLHPTEVGDLIWGVIGEIGAIDQDGRFTATTRGAGRIVATSSVTNISDTTNMVVVEVPRVTEIPLGNFYVHPGDPMSSVLAFNISNAFDISTSLDGMTVTLDPRGKGTVAQLLSNVESIALYRDANGNGILDVSDAFISGSYVSSGTVGLSFAPLSIAAGSSNTFFVSAGVSLYPHDGDSIDAYIVTASGFSTSDGSPIAGPEIINSLGYNIVDGLVSRQLTMVHLGNGTIHPGRQSVNLMTIDIPRNGYMKDTLRILSVYNAGTATEEDIDALLLYSDDGSGSWGGPDEETLIGALAFTGELWIASGLVAPLTAPQNRFYIAGDISEYPVNGATISLGIPFKGLEMSSGNDGPIDGPVPGIDTMLISTSEVLSIKAISVPLHDLTPGAVTGPLIGIQLVNTYPTAINIDSLRCTSFAEDPGGATQDELDSQFGNISLWMNLDGDYEAVGPDDALLASAPLTDGRVLFATTNLAVPANGGVVGLFLQADLDVINAKNDNRTTFGILDQTHVYVSQAANIAGNFPIRNPGEFVIDAFPSSAITVNPVEGKTLFGGQDGQLVFDFELPRDGYSDAELDIIELVNAGSAAEDLMLSAVGLWADSDGDGSFSPGDSKLGDFVFRSGIWRLSYIEFPLNSGPNRFFVVVDLVDDNISGGTLQFEIPAGGVRFVSGTTGPDDSPVGNPDAHLLFPSDRITLVSIPATSSSVAPGSDGNIILSFALYNGYADVVHTLETIRLANTSRSRSSVTFSDFELGQVSLYYDENRNRILDEDAFIGSGYFNGGQLSLTGLSVALQPRSISHFFAVATVPLWVIDADSLQIGIIEKSDLAFETPVSINGDLPLSTGGYAVIDGSVHEQYEVCGMGPGTLSPGDTSICLYGFRPAWNGDQVDTLTSVSIINLGSAEHQDLGALDLWLDADHDGIWTAGDTRLGRFATQEHGWAISSLSHGIDNSASILFVVGDISTEAIPEKTIRLAVPTDGCRFVSANDGPRDIPLAPNQSFTISDAGLRLQYGSLRSTHAIGQELRLGVQVTNLNGESVEAIHLEAMLLGDTNAARLVEALTGPVSIDPGATAEFRLLYDAVQPGTVAWRLLAYSTSVPESSAVVYTEPVSIHKAPSPITIRLVSSAPTAVALGQTHVFPLSIMYSHPDTSLSSSSPIRLDSLRLDIHDGSGMPQLASDVFSRVMLAAGYNNLAIVDSLPSESSILLRFDVPAIAAAGETQFLSLRVDIDSLAEAEDFFLSIRNASSIAVVDNNTGVAIPIDPSVSFPLSTHACRIDYPSDKLAISYRSLLGGRVNYGQRNAGLIDLILRHPGEPRSSQIQMTGLSFEFEDGQGGNIAPCELVDNVRLLRQKTPIGELEIGSADTARVSVRLSAPQSLSPGQTDTVRIEVSMKQESVHSVFCMSIRDSLQIAVRDMSSGAALVAASDTSSLVTGEIFPITTEIAELKLPAMPPEICLVSAIPVSVVGGADSVPLIDIEVRNVADSDYSPVRLTRIRLSLIDTLGNHLNPLKLFDQIGYRLLGSSVDYQQYITLENGLVIFDAFEEAMLVDPERGCILQLAADIEAGAPYDHFVLCIEKAGDISIQDATDTTSGLGFTQPDDCENVYPFTTTACRVMLPSGRPVLEAVAAPVRLAFPGQAGVTLPVGYLVYDGAELQGDVLMKGWKGHVRKRTALGVAECTAEDVLDAVHLLIDNQVIATDSVFLEGGLSLVANEDYAISHGDYRSISVAYDVNSGAPDGNYLVSFDDSSFIELVDKDMLTAIYPWLSGSTYPLLAAEVSVVKPDLGRSFTNYPNPFYPGRGEITRIAFAIDEDARIDLEIFTITGEFVRTLAANSCRTAGSYQDDVWNGYNNNGMLVAPGTYFCRITARYASGREDSFRRKIAVIR